MKKIALIFLIFLQLSLFFLIRVEAKIKPNNSIRNIYDDDHADEILFSPASLSEEEDEKEYKNFNPMSLKESIDLPIISREEWGCPDLDPDSKTYCNGPEWTPFLNPITNIIIHHTAIEEKDENWEKSVRDIWKFHSKTREWSDIGYNYLIDPDGNIYEGRYGGEFVTGGHTYLHNVGTVGISMLGNYENRNLTTKAEETLKKLIDYLSKRYKINPNKIYRDYNNSNTLGVTGHRDWDVTACPGKNVYKQLPEIRTSLARDFDGYIDSKIRKDECKKDNQTGFGSFCVDIDIEKNIVSFSGNPNSIFKFDGVNYVTTTEPNQIIKIESGETEVIVNLDEAPSSLLVKKEGDINTYYTTHFSSGEIIASKKVEISGDFKRSISSFAQYAAVGKGANDIIEGIDKNLYVANSEDATISVIYGYEDSEVFAETDAYPIALTKDKNGKLYSANYLAHSISIIEKNGDVKNIKTGGYLPIDIEFNLEKIYVLHEGSSNLISIDQKGEILDTIELMPFPNSLKIQGNYAYITHGYSNQMSKVNLQNGSVDVIYNVGDLPGGLIVFDNPDIEVGLINKLSKDFSLITFNTSEVKDLMNIAKLPVYRFWSEKLGKHFYTANQKDYETVNEKFSDTWSYEKIAFYALDPNSIVTGVNNKPTAVHRYWSSVLNSHFYTISEEERKLINEKWPDIWVYEKSDYYVYPNEQEGLVPVYRFWSEKLGSHFYAKGLTEKKLVEDLWGDVWSYENISYYVFADN